MKTAQDKLMRIVKETFSLQHIINDLRLTYKQSHRKANDCSLKVCICLSCDCRCCCTDHIKQEPAEQPPQSNKSIK